MSFLFCYIYFPLSSLRYPVLEQSPVFGGAVCALHHIWRVPVPGGAPLHPGQRDQLCGASQRLHRAAHRLLEDHQSHGRQGEQQQPTFILFYFLFEVYSIE